MSKTPREFTSDEKQTISIVSGVVGFGLCMGFLATPLGHAVSASLGTDKATMAVIAVLFGLPILTMIGLYTRQIAHEERLAAAISAVAVTPMGPAVVVQAEPGVWRRDPQTGAIVNMPLAEARAEKGRI